MWGALSDERTVLSLTTAAGPRQRSHSRIRVPLDSRSYFTVADSRHLFCRLLRLAGLQWRLSDLASTRDNSTPSPCSACNTSARTAHKTHLPRVLLLRHGAVARAKCNESVVAIT
jgi:hypothetical protein